MPRSAFVTPPELKRTVEHPRLMRRSMTLSFLSPNLSKPTYNLRSDRLGASTDHGELPVKAGSCDSLEVGPFVQLLLNLRGGLYEQQQWLPLALHESKLVSQVQAKSNLGLATRVHSQDNPSSRGPHGGGNLVEGRARTAREDLCLDSDAVLPFEHLPYLLSINPWPIRG